MRISAFSSNLRRRAAHDAPPATPPTMMTFTELLHHDGTVKNPISKALAFALLHEPAVADDFIILGRCGGRVRPLRPPSERYSKAKDCAE
jgi:hypothetical protein